MIRLASPKKLLLALFFLLCFVHLDVGGVADVESYIGLQYILLPIVFLACGQRISAFNNIAFLTLSTFMVFNVIASYRFGFNIESTRLIFAMLAFLLGYKLSADMHWQEISKIFDWVGLFVILVVLVRALSSLDEYWLSISRGQALSESYFFLTSGGKNIEVTYLFFLSALCHNKNIARAIFYLSGLLSLVYMSRVGIILFLIVLFIFASRRLSTKGLVCFVLSMVTIAPVVLYLVSPATFDRFINVQQEIEYAKLGLGRLGLFSTAIDIAKINYFGYGSGNSIAAATQFSNVLYIENNFHNIYIQFLVDFGLFCLLIFLYFVFWFYKKTISLEQKNKFALLGCVYFAVGLIQFTGLDILGWMCVGLAMPYLNLGDANAKARS